MQSSGQFLQNCRRAVTRLRDLVALSAQNVGWRQGAICVLVPLLALAVLSSACTALVVGGAGNRSGYPDARSAEARAADARISEGVRASIAADPELRQAQIKVDTLDGVVTLAGQVADYEARAQAELLTAGVSGVRGINNRLKISAGR